METNSIYSTSHRKHEIAHELNNQPIEESIMDSLENFSKQKKTRKNGSNGDEFPLWIRIKNYEQIYRRNLKTILATHRRKRTHRRS